jgi:hypothetical protein
VGHVQEATMNLVRNQDAVDRALAAHRNVRLWSQYASDTVKVGNFDHLATFKIILKIFPNSFLTIFLHENVRVLWYFWDPNLKTRFGSQKYHIFKKMLGGRSYP